MNRTQKIFQELEKIKELEKRNLHLPKYETTKGTSKWEQQRAIEGYAKYFKERPLQITEDKIGETDCNSKSSEDEDLVFSDGSSDNFVPSPDSSSNSSVSVKAYITRTKKKNIKGWCVISENEAKTNPQPAGSENQEQTHTNSIQQADVSSSTGVTKSAAPRQTFYSDLDSIEKRVHICNSEKSLSGKRIRDKRHACYFCLKTVIHMSRHLELVHKNELDITKLIAMPKSSGVRKNGFLEVMRAGDFYHNCNVLSAGRGELILVRRPNRDELKTVTYASYGPCPYCLGFMLKKHLWHHVKNMCPKKPKDLNVEGQHHIIAESNSLQSSAVNRALDNNFLRTIVDHLRNDDIGLCCKEDRLILRFGSMMFEKHGMSQCELIRQSMRQLARLTLELHRHTIQKCTLADFMKPEKFDLIIACTKKVAGHVACEIGKRSEFGIPSLALKLGYALRKCVGIERGVALRKGELKKNESLLSFLSSMELEWSVRVSSNALTTLYNRRLSVSQLLPITSDLKLINKHIDIEMNDAVSALKLNCKISTWSRLASLVLCRIILFNKRRSGESSRMTICQFLNRPAYQESTQELQASLSPYERKLAQNLTMVKTIGKRGRHVAVLLTSSLKSAIDLLISTRHECGIAENNPFVFARSSQSTMPLRGHDCLRKVIEEIKDSLQRSDLITGTKLRKYVATVSQLFSLKENEMDWLARHLGHDISVHREFYRLHEDAVELTKISRLLLAIDDGQATKFAGKSLDEINVEDLPDLEEDNDEMENGEEISQSRSQAEIKRKSITFEELSSSYELDRTETISKAQEGKNNTGNKFKSLKGKHLKWKAEEKEMVFSYFKNEIRKNVLPGKVRCEELLNQSPALKDRKWTDIKFCIKNHLTKIQRN